MHVCCFNYRFSTGTPAYTHAHTHLCLEKSKKTIYKVLCISCVLQKSDCGFCICHSNMWKRMTSGAILRRQSSALQLVAPLLCSFPIRQDMCFSVWRILKKKSGMIFKKKFYWHIRKENNSENNWIWDQNTVMINIIKFKLEVSFYVYFARV